MLKDAFGIGLATCLLFGCVTEPARETPRGLPRPQVSIAGGGGRGGDTSVLMGDVAAHFALTNKVVFGGRLLAYDYQRDESQIEFAFGRELETTRSNSGSGLGIGPELRIYPVRAFDGPWIGGGLLWFPFTTADGLLTGTDIETGIRFRTATEPVVVDFVAYGAIGWTFRTGTPLVVGIELDAGVADDLFFGGVLLRLGYEL